jgi:hypothetical protein
MKTCLVIFFDLPYRDAPNDSDAHMCIMFNDTGAILLVVVIFIITFDGSFEY